MTLAYNLITTTENHVHLENHKPITLICLHGLGASKDDLQGLAPHFKLPKGSQLLFLQAPMKAITINNGLKMPGWYDISSIDLHRYEDIVGLEQSAQNIEETCFQLVEKGLLNWDNVYFLGFSQGCATSLYIQLYYQWQQLNRENIAGIIGLSGYIPNATAWKELQENFNANIKQHQKNVPIFLAHGTNDDVVPYAKGELTLNVLESVGYKVSWNIYSYRHEISLETLKSINSWFEKVLVTIS